VTLASTTIERPPAGAPRGRAAARAVGARERSCSVKSQRSTIPAYSTQRRSCTSPQRPARLRPAQRVDQRGRLACRAARWCAGPRRPARAARPAPGPLHLEPAQLRLHEVELLAQRPDEVLDGLPLLERLAVGLLAGAGEGAGRQPLEGGQQDALVAAASSRPSRSPSASPSTRPASRQRKAVMGRPWHRPPTGRQRRAVSASRRRSRPVPVQAAVRPHRAVVPGRVLAEVVTGTPVGAVAGVRPCRSVPVGLLQLRAVLVRDGGLRPAARRRRC
jgi:hypothetical protein